MGCSYAAKAWWRSDLVVSLLNPFIENQREFDGQER
jgi:hypothetical protein